MVLSGCLGRMGLEVTNFVKNYPDIEIIAGVARFEKKSKDFPIFNDFKYLEKLRQKVGVILDFSHPACLEGLLEYAVYRKISLVICTTGYSELQILKIKEAAETVPVFFASNTSLGIAVLAKIIKIAKNTLGPKYDIEIIEKHHNKKIDAPSGTALMLAKEISDINSEYIYDRTHCKHIRKGNEIGIHTVRCGGISGEHEVLIAGKYETLILKHISHSRKLFAQGALDAVRFLINKPAGLYDMTDIMKDYYSYPYY